MANGEQPNRLDEARSELLGAGAHLLEHRPWQHPREHPDDMTLLRFAVWRSAGRDAGRIGEIRAGLALIESARSELDSLEIALVFAARAEGLTWGQIAAATGMRSPQGAQQRYQRTSERPEKPRRGTSRSVGRD